MSCDLHKTRELLMDVGAILLDVRPPAKVEGENAQESSIANAFYAPYPKFTEYLDLLPEDKTTPIIVGCLKAWFANRVMGLPRNDGIYQCVCTSNKYC